MNNNTNISFVTAGHFSGITATSLDVTSKYPWIYIIAAISDKFLYVGETFDDDGLVVRLGRHFGKYKESTVKQAASKFGVLRLSPPFFVVAAKLPFSDDDSKFDASSKKVRLLIESSIHELFISDFIPKKRWTILSRCNSSLPTLDSSIKKASISIYNCFLESYRFFEPITNKSPFNLVLLEVEKKRENTSTSVSQLIEKTEIQLFTWLLDLLKKEFGDTDWWRKGIPQEIRIKCQSTKEKDENFSHIPPEGYLTLIDFRKIVQKNWRLCDAKIQDIGGQQGKDRGTAWVVELNEMRKIWAHPIKQIFNPLNPSDVERIESICLRIGNSINTS